MNSGVTQYGGNMRDPFPVWYTGKNINATNGSRSAINANLTVGDVVIADPYQFDGADLDSTGTAGAKPVNVTRPQTSFLNMKKYVVVNVPSSVNEIPSSAASTQRRGGIVWVTDQFDDNLAHVDGTTDVSVGDSLEVTNGSFNLTKRAAQTAASTSVTFAYAGTPDFAFANAVQSNTTAGFAFSNNDEYGAMLTVLQNTQTRVNELASLSTGGMCAVALEAYTTNSAALKRVRFNGNRMF